MAKRIVHQLIDDIDGTLLGDDEGETLHFSLDGTLYEIDLSDANAQKLRDALRPFIDAGRRANSAGAPAKTPRKRPSRSPEAARIRAWAAENGHTVSERGRVPAPVIEAYRAAQG